MDQGELITQYGRHVDARTAAVFIGAGLSMPAGYPSWSELLEPLRAQLGIDPVDDLPQLAQYYVDDTPSGREHIQTLIADQFADRDRAPTLAHRLLARLPIDEFWTTNYDTLLERAVDGAVVIVDDQQLAQAIEPGSRLVYKMHGSVTQPGSAVLTRDDYDRYPDQHPRIWHLLRAQVLTTSFLFLGFGFSDPNLDLVFQLVRLRTADIKRDHFTIMKRPGGGDPDADHRLFELRIGELGRAGVHVVVVDSYDEIALILGKLMARCRPPQLMISGSTPSTRPAADAAAPYPTSPVPDALANTATLLGAQLAHTPTSVVGGSEVAALVGYELMRALAADHTYDPRRFTLLRRQRDQPLDAPNLRLGVKRSRVQIPAARPDGAGDLNGEPLVTEISQKTTKVLQACGVSQQSRSTYVVTDPSEIVKALGSCTTPVTGGRSNRPSSRWCTTCAAPPVAGRPK